MTKPTRGGQGSNQYQSKPGGGAAVSRRGAASQAAACTASDFDQLTHLVERSGLSEGEAEILHAAGHTAGSWARWDGLSPGVSADERVAWAAAGVIDPADRESWTKHGVGAAHACEYMRTWHVDAGTLDQLIRAERTGTYTVTVDDGDGDGSGCVTTMSVNDDEATFSCSSHPDGTDPDGGCGQIEAAATAVRPGEGVHGWADAVGWATVGTWYNRNRDPDRRAWTPVETRENLRAGFYPASWPALANLVPVGEWSDRNRPDPAGSLVGRIVRLADPQAGIWHHGEP